jgi:hypothetical protein
MLPFYMSHYAAFADEIFIADDGSTDGSLDYLSQFPQVTVSRFENSGNSFVEAAQAHNDQCWKNSRGKADWVILCNVDEHVYHPRMREYLEQATKAGVNSLPAIGYDMVSDDFPDDDGKSRLCELVTRGITSKAYTKLSFFNPNAFEEMNFGPGRHKLEPVGNVVGVSTVSLKMLHFKFMGPEYVIERHALLGARLKEGDIQNDYGSHYFKPAEEVYERVAFMKERAVNVLEAKEYVVGTPRR